MNLCKVGTIYLYLKARMADVVSDSSRTKRKTNRVQQQQMDEPNFVHHSADGSNIIVKAAADRTPQRNCSGEWRQFDFDRHKTWKWMSQYEWRKSEFHVVGWTACVWHWRWTTPTASCVFNNRGGGRSLCRWLRSIPFIYGLLLHWHGNQYIYIYIPL